MELGLTQQHPPHQQQHQQQQQKKKQQQGLEASSEEGCFIIMMEVLDNLPHDRLVWSEADAHSPWLQTMVVPLDSPHAVHAAHASQDPGSTHAWQAAAEAARAPSWGAAAVLHSEVLGPAEDPLILRCLRSWAAAEQERNVRENVREAASPWHQLLHAAMRLVGKPGDFTMGRALQAAAIPLLAAVIDGAGGSESSTVFLPTGCLRLLDAVHAARPNHVLIAADFTALPDAVIEGRNAPLVATTVRGALFMCAILCMHVHVPRRTACHCSPSPLCNRAQTHSLPLLSFSSVQSRPSLPLSCASTP
jgi:hypothetical protein